MRLYPQSKLMVIRDKRLSDKEQGQEIKEKEGTRQDQTQQTVRLEIKETVRNPRVKVGREDKEINMDTKENGRTNLGRSYTQWNLPSQDSPFGHFLENPLSYEIYNSPS